MGRRFDVIAMSLLSFSMLSACEPYRRAKECRGISDLVNPTLRAIDVERKTKDDAPAYARIAVLYDGLATFLRAACSDFSCCSNVVRKAAGQENIRFFNVFSTNSVANRSAAPSAREDRNFVYWRRAA